MDSIVRQGYNLIADSYVQNRSNLKSGKYIQKLLKLLPKKSLIVDVGCGAGIGVDDLLLKAGHNVIGIDNSTAMIKLARQLCPSGDYVEMDMKDLKYEQFRSEAVVAFYALFHIERSKHLNMLKTWASFLPKKGLLLVTMGDRAFEGNHTMYGEQMWSSQWGSQKNIELVRQAGFDIMSHEIDTSGAERHLVVLAKKK